MYCLGGRPTGIYIYPKKMGCLESSSGPFQNLSSGCQATEPSLGVASVQTLPLKKPTISGSTPGGNYSTLEKAHHWWLHPWGTLKALTLWVPLVIFSASPGVRNALLRLNMDLLIQFDWLMTSAAAIPINQGFNLAYILCIQHYMAFMYIYVP